MEPSQLGSFKGVKTGQRIQEFILVWPLTVKVKAYDPVVVGLLGFR